MQLQTQIQDARSEYIKACAKIAGQRWDEFDESYSFDAAFDEGVPPLDAVKDCEDWLDQ